MGSVKTEKLDPEVATRFCVSSQCRICRLPPITADLAVQIKFRCFDNPIPLRGIACPKKVGFLISLPAPPY